MKFKSSPNSTLGMEIEFQLLDSNTLDLVDGILPLMTSYPEHPFTKPEYNQATVEINSKVCSNIRELEADVFSIFSTLQARCEELGMTLCGAGTHPFCQRLVAMTPVKRYLAQYKMAGYLSYWITFAQHIHVGMTSGDEAVAIAGMLKPYLPILLALSANSPFWWGYDTGYASFRQRLLASRQTYGMPPTFKNWQDFSAFFKTIKSARIVENFRDLHWDLRLQPHLGTLEIRIMDAQPTLKEALMLAAFVHSLTVYLQGYRQRKEEGFLLIPNHWWLEKENYFQASHLGLEANYIEDAQGRSRPIKKVITDILDSLTTTGAKLGETEYLELVREYLEGIPSYSRQRQIWQATGSLQQVVASLVRELKQNSSQRTGGDAQNWLTTIEDNLSLNAIYQEGLRRRLPEKIF
ncbi:MAG: YbdK family carboxylate-amine ligase [Xenococcaceae cyanobacterium MO_234.B1]|nr:YbdK family carboxylate-amine ligase [Xenococcaceae cyanobacterium MO_234.B1]